MARAVFLYIISCIFVSLFVLLSKFICQTAYTESYFILLNFNSFLNIFSKISKEFYLIFPSALCKIKIPWAWALEHKYFLGLGWKTEIPLAWAGNKTFPGPGLENKDSLGLVSGK